MRAGLLREHITFLRLDTQTGPSGAVRKTYRPFRDARAAQRRTHASSATDAINAREDFFENTAYLDVRPFPELDDTLRVEWQGRLYEIRLCILSPRRDYATLTLSRIND